MTTEMALADDQGSTSGIEPPARTASGNEPVNAGRTGFVFETFVWVGVIGLTAFSIIGMVLAVSGWFHPIPVILATVVVTVAGVKWIHPAVRDDVCRPRPHWLLTLGVLVLAMAFGIWNGAHHGEHLIAERDPGVYAATGLWLADHGDLRVAPPEGPFDGAPGVRQVGIGFSPHHADSLDPQFAHLNAVYLAAGSWAGNTRMLLVPQLLMAAALVMLYALGVRLGKPIGGAAGALALAVSYPYIFVARDTYSEPISLLVLLSGLWALTFVRKSGVRAGLIAGTLLGATCLARIDGYVALIPVAGVIALEYTIARRRGDTPRSAGYLAAYVAMGVVATAAALEVWSFSRSYYNSNLGPRLFGMVSGMLVATALGAAVGRYLFQPESDDAKPRKILAWAFAPVAAAIVAVLIWARFVRPDFVGLRHAIDGHGPVLELLPWAKTISYLWLEWYLGPLLVAGGFAGLIWMAARGLLRGERSWLPVAGVGLTTTLLYLISPSITPDQPWAMRRFVAISIPLLILAAGMGLETIGRRRPPWTAIGAGVLGCLALVAPIRMTDRLADTAVGDSLAVRFDRICTLANEQPSAILVTPAQGLGRTIPVALQGWCDLPVAGAIGGITPGEILELSLRWKADGRRLLLLSTSPEGLVGIGGEVDGVPGPVLMGPQHSLTHAPDGIVPDARVAQSPDGVLPLFLVEASGFSPVPDS